MDIAWEGSPTNIEMFLDSLQRVAPADTGGGR